MLVHIDQVDIAGLVHNAWLKAIEDGVHTYDIYEEGVSTKKIGTKEFASAVVERLGTTPEKLKPVEYRSAPQIVEQQGSAAHPAKALVGVDIFLEWSGGPAAELGEGLKRHLVPGLSLSMLSNRGVRVWPDGFPETFLSDHWRCRFMGADPATPVTHAQVVAQLDRLGRAGYDFIKTEHLCTFDGERGYSLEGD
jgi:isocitrate dehydrogenase